MGTIKKAAKEMNSELGLGEKKEMAFVFFFHSLSTVRKFKS